VREYVRNDPAGPLRAAVDNARIAHRWRSCGTFSPSAWKSARGCKARLVEAELYADEREPLIAKLRNGLALAETLLAERDAEIERLRAGLAHAEKLAFERAHELEELQKSWIWKARVFLMRKKARGAPHPPA
jgi:hypothetical protein